MKKRLRPNSAAAPSICPVIHDGAETESSEAAAEKDAFGGSADDVAAEETRRKIELFAWADSILRLTEAEVELELDAAVKRFKMTRASLKRIVGARRSEKAKAKTGRRRDEPDDDQSNVKYYGRDFKVSDRGVFVRKLDDTGQPYWEQICTTQIDIEALTRDGRAENWGVYIVITNRDGGGKSSQSLSPSSNDFMNRRSSAPSIENSLAKANGFDDFRADQLVKITSRDSQMLCSIRNRKLAIRQIVLADFVQRGF